MENAHQRLPLLVHRDHRRTFADNFYVYAVVSRRSKGVSVGLNLNPDKVCNFDCVYCQVDRTTPGPTRDVDVERLRDELEEMLDRVQSGRLFEEERFRQTPAALRRLNDIAFSGGGEPPPRAELEAFCDRLDEIVRAGGAIKLVQVYTVARRPAEDYVGPLGDAEVDAVVELVRGRTGLAAEPFYGPS